jgi:alanine-glyoxylate transaminase/serine-glyoxylate transaminase/serine-pyruvate transaminase
VTNIYAGEVADLCYSMVADLPRVVRTTGHAFVGIANGHGAWEMALVNTLSKGDRVVVADTGRFGLAWAGMCRDLGVEAELLSSTSPRLPFDPSVLADRLAADTEHSIRGVLVCHVDTGSGVRADLAAIRAAIDAADHPALFFVDGIASVGCEHYEMDALGVDVTISASQKGLMVPPGLGFVWAGPKAIEASERADLVTPYWSWLPRRSEGPHYQLFCGTPPVSHLFAIRVALDMLLDEGMEHVWWRHEVLAGAVRAAVEAWSTDGGLELQVQDPAARSNAITGVLTNGIDATALRERCEDATNLTLGIGLGDSADHAFRIGHMGHLNPPMILGTLGALESVLISLDHPLGGSGVAAAAAFVAQALAQGTAQA